MSDPKMEFHPLTPDRWVDFQELFGKRGACGGCWCMFWRLPHAEYQRGTGEGHRRAMRSLVKKEVPGILAYDGGEPVGWCALGPRDHYLRLERSRILKPIDDEPVWSVVCFFVRRGFRRRGVTVKLLRAAIDHAKRAGAKILEGYPVEPKTDRAADTFLYTGIASGYRKAGFVECLRRSDTRPIMRYYIGRRKR
jgi:GNAT superfamily N-acetyltransferase